MIRATLQAVRCRTHAIDGCEYGASVFELPGSKETSAEVDSLA